MPEGLPDRPARRRVHEPRRLRAPRQDGPAVGAEEHVDDPLVELQGRADPPSRRRLPDLNGPMGEMISDRQGDRALGAKGHDTDKERDGIAIAAGWPEGLARG